MSFLEASLAIGAIVACFAWIIWVTEKHKSPPRRLPDIKIAPFVKPLPDGPPMFKKGDKVPVFERFIDGMDMGTIIDVPEWRMMTEDGRYQWWYAVMTEQRYKHPGVIGCGGISRPPYPNEMFQWYYEMEGNLYHIQGPHANP